MNSIHRAIFTIVVLISALRSCLGSSPSSSKPILANTCSSNANKAQEENGGYQIIRDKVVYSRWRSIISRMVKMPNGNEVDFDVSFD
jgi:hypothetical protein